MSCVTGTWYPLLARRSWRFATSTANGESCSAAAGQHGRRRSEGAGGLVALGRRWVGAGCFVPLAAVTADELKVLRQSASQI